ncbi:MAG: HEAT repeat domain-containing protein [Myxococcales bacterium]
MSSPIDDTPPEAEATPELPEEQQLGGTAAARQVNDALRALSRAARAFTLYDAQNEAIRRFLGDFRERLQRTTAAVGVLQLDVRPFELLFVAPGSRPEVVYREDDRERSLAYRLFRDGVRKLAIHPQVSWDEQLRLLEILSVRYVGVRQNEDDLVTLLTKAAFKGIRFEAVEGFVAQGDEDGADSEFATRHAPADRVQAPPDFDLPAPPPLPAKAFSYREVPASYLQALQAEESADTVPDRALRLVHALLSAAADAGQPLQPADVLATIAEIRDFLVADQRLGHLLQLVVALQAYRDAGAGELSHLVAVLGNDENRARLLEAVPPETPQPPPELLELFAKVPGDHLPWLLERLASDEARRHLVRGLLARSAAARWQELLARLKDAPGAVAGELLGLLLEKAPEKGLLAAAELVQHPEAAMQARVVELLGPAPKVSEVGDLLIRLLQSPHAEVRVSAMRQIGARHEARAFDPLVERAQGLDPDAPDVEEASAIGETLARLVPSTAQGLFTSWVKPKSGLLRRVVDAGGPRPLQFVAIAGLGALRGEEPEQLIREVSQRADDALKQHCVAVMVKRRREGRGRG